MKGSIMNYEKNNSDVTNGKLIIEKKQNNDNQVKSG